ncbi:unnamed protein product, partial [Tetraodon nigroviridis]
SMSQRMVWVDLEMTGLDIEKDQIIEMACLITDSDLNILAEGPNLIINQPDELLDGMSEWCKEHHGKSGLTQAVRNSKITLEQAEYEFLSFVRQHTPPGQCPLAGGQLCACGQAVPGKIHAAVHAPPPLQDHRCQHRQGALQARVQNLAIYLKGAVGAGILQLIKKKSFITAVVCCAEFTFYILMVPFGNSNACRRWFPEEYKQVPPKKATHRALSDIYESIKELQFYRSSIFRVPAAAPLSKIVENGG